MRAKIGLITAFLLMLALAPGLTFADDFQSYNSITDASFTSNYSVSVYNVIQIAQAPNDSLTLNLTQGYLFINTSKLNVSYPFTFSYTMRAGSGYSDNIKIYFYLNNSDTDTNISVLRGYYIKIADTSMPNALTLYRFNPSGAILLNSSNFPPWNSTNDMIFILSVDSNKRVHFYLNGIEYMNYYDTAETYLSGGIAIYTLSSPDSTYIDNLNSNATVSTLSGYNNPANWHVLGWLNNIENLPGYYQSASHNINLYGNNCVWKYPSDLCVWSCQMGLLQGCDGDWNGQWLGGTSAQIKSECGVYACDVTNITYQLHGSTITETSTSPLGSGYDDFALPNKYYDGITAYFTVLGQPFTEAIRAGIHVLPYMRLKASAPGCVYVSSDKWLAILMGGSAGVSQYESAIPTADNNDYWGGNYWKHDNSGDYVVSITEGFFCNNSNNITVSYDFYDTSTSTGTILFTKDVTFPVGYVTTTTGTGVGSNFSFNASLPFDCVFNASLCAGAGNLPIHNVTCTPGVNCPVAPSTTTPLFTDFTGLGGLVTPLTVLLSAVLIAGAIITRDTHSSQIGLIVIMAGCLMLSFYNILPWYITVLITIGAGFFILSQVRGGLFGTGPAPG